MVAKSWLKITIHADPLLIEPISDFLIGIIDAGVETGAKDEPHYGVVTGYVQKPNLDEGEVKVIQSQLSSFLVDLAGVFKVQTPEFSLSLIAEEDWGSTWKVHFKPFPIVPGLVIAPTWEDYQPVAGEAVITMDPGMAFGTGHHATTCLCLEFLQKSLAESNDVRVLDVGTGTGILGMAALLFGGAEVMGIDNDPEAVAAAEENALRNEMEDRMKVYETPISEVPDQYAVVVANIVHDVLIGMAEELTRLTKNGGILILSGILAGEQTANIQAVFTSHGFSTLELAERKEWAALRLQKM